jgi:hypothetical protein
VNIVKVNNEENHPKRLHLPRLPEKTKEERGEEKSFLGKAD